MSELLNLHAIVVEILLVCCQAASQCPHSPSAWEPVGKTRLTTDMLSGIWALSRECQLKSFSL